MTIEWITTMNNSFNWLSFAIDCFVGVRYDKKVVLFLENKNSWPGDSDVNWNKKIRKGFESLLRNPMVIQALTNVIKSSWMVLNQSITAFILAARESQSQSSIGFLVYLFIYLFVVEICSVRRPGSNVSSGRNHPSHGGWVRPQSPAVLTLTLKQMPVVECGAICCCVVAAATISNFRINAASNVCIEENAAFYIQIGRQSNSISHYILSQHNPFKWNILHYCYGDDISILNRPELIQIMPHLNNLALGFWSLTVQINSKTDMIILVYVIYSWCDESYKRIHLTKAPLIHE